MIERGLPLLALLLLPAALRVAHPVRAIEPFSPDRPIVDVLPEDPLIVVTAPGLSELSERGLEDPAVAALLGAGIDEILRAEAGMDAAELLAVADDKAGVPVLPTVAALTRRDAALGIWLSRGSVVWMLALHGDDEEVLRDTLSSAFGRLEGKYGAPAGSIDGARKRYRDADVWQLGEDVSLAARDELFLASNSHAMLETALERAASNDVRPNLSEAMAEALAASRRGEGTLVSAAVDLVKLDALARFGNGEGMRRLRSMPATPAVQLLLGPGIAELGSARAAGIAVTLTGTNLGLRAIGVDTEATDVLTPEPNELAPPALARNARDVAGALVYRDFADALENRVDLFPAETMPKFAKAESDLALFFGGDDLTRDVLSGLAPWTRLVAREVDFAPGREPENPLPAAAAIFVLEDPEVLGPKLVSAFQTAIGAVNLQRAQDREPAFLLGLESVGTSTLTTAGLPTPGAEDGVDAIYNLEPACAHVGDLFVLATHGALARELALELEGRSAQPRAQLDEELSIQGGGVRSILAANRETLIAQNVLEKGHSMAAARAEIEMLERLVGAVRSVGVEIHGATNDPRSIEVEVRIALTPARGEER